jgi:hypothetical protein
MIAAMPSRTAGLCFCFIIVLCSASPALITGGQGNRPVEDRGWPAGAVELANLGSRIAWWEGPPFGGGEYHFEYRGDAEACNRALELFAAIRMPRLEVSIHPGPHDSFWLNPNREKRSDVGIDWTFTVWNAENWNHLYNNPAGFFDADDPNFRKPVDPPRMDIYAGGGRIDFAKVKIPAGLHVADERASANGIAAADAPALRGTVYDMTTSKPVSGVRITLIAPRSSKEIAAIVTNSDGKFEMLRVPPDPCRIVASGEGYAPRQIGYAAFAGDTLTTFDNVQLCAAGTLAGTITDEGHKPLAGVRVMVTPIAIDGRGYRATDEPQTTTDAQGHFQFTDLPKGFATLHCSSKTHYHSSFQTGGPVAFPTLYPVPSTDVAIEMTATGTVRVTVVGPDGKPASGEIHVSLYPPGNPIGKWGGSSKIKADGTAEFNGVPPGAYFVSADPMASINRDTSAKSITVKSGQITTVQIAAPARVAPPRKHSASAPIAGARKPG